MKKIFLMLVFIALTSTAVMAWEDCGDYGPKRAGLEDCSAPEEGR